MKKLLIAMLSVSLLGAAALPALAAGGQTPAVISPAPDAGEEISAPGYSIEIDGEELDARGCMMVPLRPVAEKLGFPGGL